MPLVRPNFHDLKMVELTGFRRISIWFGMLGGLGVKVTLWVNFTYLGTNVWAGAFFWFLR